MNMEPLVPALPSTNEYEETATDNGRTCLCFTNTHIQHKQTHTHMRPPATDLWEVTWGLPCRTKHMDMDNAQTESVN